MTARRKTISLNTQPHPSARLGERLHDEHTARLVSEEIALHLIGLLREADVDVRELLRSSDLTDSASEFMRTGARTAPDRALQTFNARAINAVASRANEQDGRAPVRARDWRMMFLCLASSASLREAIARAADFYDMLGDRWGRLTLQVSGPTAELSFHSLRIRRNAVALTADTVGIAALHGLLSWLIGQTIPLSAVLLQYESALRPPFLSETLPFPTRMGADRTAVRFPSKYLDYPVIRTAQDGGHRLILSFALDLERAEGEIALPERARRIMYQTLQRSHRIPSLQALSDHFQQSRATLRRQLKQAGVSYNQLKNSCRREAALSLLRHSDLTIEDIADQLGFCDSDAFRRSFRSWIGVSPSIYRQRADAGRGADVPPRARPSAPKIHSMSTAEQLSSARRRFA